MALISCSECGKQISDRADACPHCGAPVVSAQQAQPVYAATAPTQNVYGKSKRDAGGWACSVISVFTLIISLILMYVTHVHIDSAVERLKVTPISCSVMVFALILGHIADGYSISVTKDVVIGTFPYRPKMRLSPAEITAVSAFDANDFSIWARGKEYKFKNIPNRDQVVKSINELIAAK